MLGRAIKDTWSTNLQQVLNLKLEYEYYNYRDGYLTIIFNLNGRRFNFVDLYKNDFPIDISTNKMRIFINQTAIIAQLFPKDIENILLKNRKKIENYFNSCSAEKKLPSLQPVIPQREIGRFFNLVEFITFFYIKMLSGIPSDVLEAILIRNEAIKEQKIIMQKAIKIKRLKNNYIKKYGNIWEKSKVYLNNFFEKGKH